MIINAPHRFEELLRLRMQNNVAELRQKLRQSGKPYINLDALDGPTARVQFIGTFQGREVAWNAILVTLSHCYLTRLRQRQNNAEKTLQIQQFIDVGRETKNGIELTVALPVDSINEPAVLKTIIMIRNYKRLKQGRHAFGPYYHFP
jgi:hypothetical protein